MTTSADKRQEEVLSARAQGMARQIDGLQGQIKSLVDVVKDLQEQIQLNQFFDDGRETPLRNAGITAKFQLHTKSSPSLGTVNSKRRQSSKGSAVSDKLEHTF